MCGIFGAIRTTGKFSGEQYAKFRGLTDIVQYRGPDDAGYLAIAGGDVVSEGRPFDIFLGHRRLSIIDLSSAGHQPMTDGDGLWLTYNGEIFNFVELREELVSRGHRFETATDTEVILHLYQEYGEAGFSRMNGMWAFALVDVRRKRVVLSRDRFSIKPLYIVDAGRELYFASEIKQLLPLLASVQPNLRTMNAFVDQALFDHDLESFYTGVDRVAPATNVVLDLSTGQRFTRRYWDWPEPQALQGDVVEQFRELLLDSIRIRLRSDVKVGTLLSGGLDSSAIAVLTDKLTRDSATYSMISEDECSEEPYIDIVAAAIGCPNVKITAQPEHAMNSIQQVLFHHDEPVGGLDVVAQFMMMRAIRNQSDSTVLLSGQGADEVLLGYLKYFAFHLQELASRKKYASVCGEIIGSIVHRTVWHQFRLGKARRYRSSTRPREFLLKACHRAQLWKALDLRSRQIADIESYSVPALTHYEDRSAMAFGLEVRHPFLDHRLVEFSINLPIESKISQGWMKHILRESVPELPRRIRWRRDKQGFVMPESQWLKRDLADSVQDLFQRSVLEEMGVLDSRKFLDFYQNFRTGSTGIWHSEITRVLMCELWARQFRSSLEMCNQFQPAAAVA